MSAASPDVQLLDVTGPDGSLCEPDWLAAAVKVHRQLRPQLSEVAEDYSAKMQRVFKDGGRMLVAVRHDKVCGVGVWRVTENTFDGVRFYVDDLVTDDASRSQGIGKAMLDGLRTRAIAFGCDSFALDSGVQRQQAHKFYFREGMVVTSFSFKQALHS
jgi:GNAT superfamily N-acetyltransferase